MLPLSLPLRAGDSWKKKTPGGKNRRAPSQLRLLPQLRTGGFYTIL